MKFWHKCGVTLTAMLIVSLLFGLLWRQIFAFAPPDYVAGVIGGITAIPVWEYLKKKYSKPL